MRVVTFCRLFQQSLLENQTCWVGDFEVATRGGVWVALRDYDPSSVLHHLSGHNPAVVIDGTYRFNVIATHQPGKVLYMGAKYGALFFWHFTDYS